MISRNPPSELQLPATRFSSAYRMDCARQGSPGQHRAADIFNFYCASPIIMVPTGLNVPICSVQPSQPAPCTWKTWQKCHWQHVDHLYSPKAGTSAGGDLMEGVTAHGRGSKQMSFMVPFNSNHSLSPWSSDTWISIKSCGHFQQSSLLRGNLPLPLPEIPMALVCHPLGEFFTSWKKRAEAQTKALTRSGGHGRTPNTVRKPHRNYFLSVKI